MDKIKKIGIVAIVVIVLIAFWGGSWYGNQNKEDEHITDETTKVTETVNQEEVGEKIGVHVVGAVANPGLYYFNTGARVDDAIKAAVALDTASLESLNLAAYISDGMQIKVPTENEVMQTYTNTGGTVVTTSETTHFDMDGRLNINTATKEELMELPGIGDVYSGRIIEYRQSNGGFKTVDELTNVKGISTKTLAKFSDQIYVG